MKSKREIVVSIDKGDNVGFFNFNIKVVDAVKKFIKENVKSKNVIVGKFGDTDIDVSQTVSDANYKITLTIEKSGEDEEDEKNEYTKE